MGWILVRSAKALNVRAHSAMAIFNVDLIIVSPTPAYYAGSGKLVEHGINGRTHLLFRALYRVTLAAIAGMLWGISVQRVSR